MNIKLAAVAALFSLAGLAVAGAAYYFTAMPLRSFAGPRKPLSSGEVEIRDELALHVGHLAGDIGERNLAHPAALAAAADYLETRLRDLGYTVTSYPYSVEGQTVRTLEVQIQGRKYPSQNVVVGGHYDSVLGTPGADDNASGVAAVLVLARLLQASKPERTIRLASFPNEEPPYFQTERMGSLVYAKELRKRGVEVTAMLSLETIGFYSDEKGSQHYPAGFGLLYSDTGNFIGFVGDINSRPLVQQAVKAFRESTEFPSEGVAAPAALTGIGWSDHWSFWQTGNQAIMVTDTAPFRYRYYHDAGDQPDQLDFARMARVVGGLQQVILKLANDT